LTPTWHDSIIYRILSSQVMTQRWRGRLARM
jgi:hypothetical protein